jgi:hypothetical protein
MKVELAWLADPVTSPWRLEARTVGGKLEVHGQVPNEVVLERALQVAHGECGTTVVSKVQLTPTLRPPSLNRPQELLHREAFDAMRQGFPEQAAAISVSTRANGEIVLKGTVPTYEDKLAISRHLREATACRSVKNELRVLTEPKDGSVSGGLHALEATALPPQRPKQDPVQTVSHMSVSEAPTVASVSHRPDSGLEEATAHADNANGHPSTEKPSASGAKPAAKPLVYQTKWRKLDPGEVGVPKKTVPAATAKEPAAASKTAASTDHTFLRVIPSPKEELKDSSGGSPLPKTDLAHLSKQPSQPRSELVQHSASSADPPAEKPSRPVTAAYPPPPPVRAPLPPPLTVAKREPYVSEGVVIVESMIKPAGHSMSPAVPKPAVLRTGPYVTNGVILFSDSANEDHASPNPALKALQTRLQQRIAAACGKASSDVEVTAAAETTVTVRVKARSTLEGEELSNQIFRLPELAPCQVSLDIVVMK